MPTHDVVQKTETRYIYGVFGVGLDIGFGTTRSHACLGNFALCYQNPYETVHVLEKRNIVSYKGLSVKSDDSEKGLEKFVMLETAWDVTNDRSTRKLKRDLSLTVVSCSLSSSARLRE